MGPWAQMNASTTGSLGLDFLHTFWFFWVSFFFSWDGQLAKCRWLEFTLTYFQLN